MIRPGAADPRRGHGRTGSLHPARVRASLRRSPRRGSDGLHLVAPAAGGRAPVRPSRHHPRRRLLAVETIAGLKERALRRIENRLHRGRRCGGFRQLAGRERPDRSRRDAALHGHGQRRRLDQGRRPLRGPQHTEASTPVSKRYSWPYYGSGEAADKSAAGEASHAGCVTSSQRPSGICAGRHSG